MNQRQIKRLSLINKIVIDKTFPEYIYRIDRLVGLDYHLKSLLPDEYPSIKRWEECIENDFRVLNYFILVA